MTAINDIDMQHYLSTYYLTLPQLSAYSGVDPDEIEHLIYTHCVPPHSYEMRSMIHFSNPLIEQVAATKTTKYYHRCVVDWIKDAIGLSQTFCLSQVAGIMREKFNRDFEQYFGDVKTPGCQGLDQAWTYLMRGIWGICLKELSVECMAKKEFARKVVAEISSHCTIDSITAQQREQLMDAVSAYNEATLPFDPIFLEHSSRCREIQAAITRFQLAIDNRYSTSG